MEAKLPVMLDPAYSLGLQFVQKLMFRKSRTYSPLLWQILVEGAQRETNDNLFCGQFYLCGLHSAHGESGIVLIIKGAVNRNQRNTLIN